MRHWMLIVSCVTFGVLSAAAMSVSTSAQNGSPAPSTPGAKNAEQTRAVLDPYLAALGAREDIAPYLAADVVLSLVEVGQEIRGRDAVATTIDELHQQTFDARPEVVNLVVGDGVAAGEFVFVGTHTGEFVGIPATGREVRVPYTVFYDVSDGQITSLRIYGFASGLVAQLTAENPAIGTPAASG